MTALVHATLQRLTVTAQPGKDRPPLVKEAEGSRPLAVQFNPATLRISRNNNVDRGGATTKNQKVQHPAQEGSTLAFDLEFDTAEQRGGGRYVDVRRWTALVRQFVEPPAKTSDAPPAVRFVWGTLRYNGIVTQVTEELDHFAPDGTPLRAKVGVTIVEQNFAYQAHGEGPGTRDARTATEAGDQRTGAAPGTAGTSRPRQVVQARDGESAQQLLSRLGLDPAAWRGAMSGLDSPLTLAAGAAVQLGAEVSAGFAAAAGISLSAGFAGDPAPTSVGGLAAALGAGGGPGADPALAGFVLGAAGGIAASADIVAGAAVDRATARARQGFEVPDAAAGPPAAEPGRPRGPAG
ncbi:CIS tube protein, partial [Streptomyces sp. NPDC055796]